MLLQLLTECVAVLAFSLQMLSLESGIAQESSMKRLGTIIILVLIAGVISATSSAYADDNTFREIFRDSFYGGAAGSLVGAAVMILTQKPANHLDYIAFGAASGVLAGATYGVVKSSMALASLENGTVKIALPAIIPDVVETPSNGKTKVTWRAEILRGAFN
jgi:hypothetical protein